MMKRHRWNLFAALLAAMTLGSTSMFAQDDAAEQEPAQAAQPDDDQAAPEDETPGEDGAAPEVSEPEQEPTGDGETTTEPPEPGPKAQAWEAKLQEWKTLLADLRDLREQYSVAKEEDLERIRTKYDAQRTQGEKVLAELKVAARAAFDEAPNEDRQLARFMLKIVADEIRAERYENAIAEAQYLVDNEFDNPQIFDIAGVAAYSTNRMAQAKEFLDKAAAADALTKEGREAHERIDEFDIVKLWEAEQKIRAAEAKADDLPRVKLTTTQGDIVLELFENEAPKTVGNFISLVNNGFYDGRLFHRVIGGFMAQTGCPKGDGSGGPGYRIYCECYEDGARNHFAGTLSMAHAGKDTGGSQFYMTFRPTPFLNGRHTVFGRVVEGWDTLAKIERYDPSGEAPKPPLDKIVEAEVLRDRGHDEYKPNKVK